MKRLSPWLALVAAVASTGRVVACPCQGSSGAAAGVTTAFERFGASLTETARFVHGSWRPNGVYAPLSPGARQAALDVTGVVGYRPLSAVELDAEAAVGHQAASSPDYSSSHTGFGDTTVRVRWEAVDEPMPYEKTALPWPALTVVASLRMATAASGRAASASGFSGTTGSVGAAASSEGLGTWEPALAVALIRSVGNRWQLSAFSEGAYRFADTYLGIERHLAPRVLGQLGARYTPSSATAIGLLTDLGYEGDVAYASDPTLGASTSQRLWTISAYGYLRAEPTRLRWGALVRYAPPVDDLGKNATRSTSVAVSIGYSLP